MQPLLLAIPRILGLRLDDCLLWLTVAIPSFFLCRWLFRKFIKSNLLVAFAAGIAAVVVIPFLIVALILVGLKINAYYPRDEFNRSRWLADKEKRYELSDDIISKKLLLGKSKAEVEQLLGRENNTQNNNWEYYIGFLPGFGAIDPYVLSIEFSSGKVRRVWQHET